MGKKFYVVWTGREPGVYDDWDDAKEQVENFPGARYKAFSSAEAAADAFRKGSDEASGADLGKLLVGGRQQKHSKTKAPSKGPNLEYLTIPEIDLDAWAVDASCMGNPGIMEYQGVELMSGKRLFRIGPFKDATNNIGEFLAIVHAMALMAKQGKYHNIYSDSVSAMAWVRNKRIKTTLQPTEANRQVFELMARAMAWLNNNKYPGKVMKWQTELWGEIPADFGRK